NKTEKDVVLITAEYPELRIAPGCGYSIDFATAVIVNKFLYHLPYERQAREVASLGLRNMSTQVLYNVARLTDLHFESIIEEIENEILSRSLVHADETTWPINNKKDSDGYMWIISNQLGSYYRFEPIRSGRVIKETLANYEGWLMMDGYSGYRQLKEKKDKEVLFLKIKLAHCHAHARRYFKDVEEVNPEIKEYLEFYKELSLYEKQAKDFEDLKIIRQTKSKPLIEKMHTGLLDQLPKSRAELGFRKAIEYSLNQWPQIIKFLDDPVIPLTNNEAGRSIRQVVMGRKNFYGSRSIDGADLAAMIYTIIESCKKFEIDPRNYILETLKASAAKQKTLTPYKFALKLRSQRPA
ncbi:MAG: IS66 family transposase, partial [Bdellovibrionaceae bacterium]|nr:IS66 family transposase [Bdellovibrio sp.]